MTGFANPLSTLAPRMPSQQCVHRIRRSFKTTFTTIPERPDRRSLFHLLTGFHHHRRRRPPKKAFAQSRNSIQYP